jgi:hypothetical protein
MIQSQIRKGERAFNPTATAMVYPGLDCFYVNFFWESRYDKYVASNDTFEDFCYWDNVDRDENISEEDWYHRGSLWGAIIDKSDSWAEAGFSYEFIDDHFAWDIAMHIMYEKGKKENGKG